ncbi:MAG: hypothetical protein ACI9LE_001373 [Paraglaciecola sp.]|jgi:hypothetical protein
MKCSYEYYKISLSLPQSVEEDKVKVVLRRGD